MSSAVIPAVAALFLAMGRYGPLAPTALIRPFEITLPSAEARAEARAVYGGFGVAVALVLIGASFDLNGIRVGAVTAVAAALLGMAGGRLVARLVEAPRAFYPVWFYFWVEITGAGALLLAALNMIGLAFRRRQSPVLRKRNPHRDTRAAISCRRSLLLDESRKTRPVKCPMKGCQLGHPRRERTAARLCPGLHRRAGPHRAA